MILEKFEKPRGNKDDVISNERFKGRSDRRGIFRKGVRTGV
jgi:hypothetical protein